MLQRNKPKVKAAFADTLEYQGILGTTVHQAEMAEMDSEVIRAIRVSLHLSGFPIADNVVV